MMLYLRSCQSIIFNCRWLHSYIICDCTANVIDPNQVDVFILCIYKCYRVELRDTLGHIAELRVIFPDTDGQSGN